MELPVAVRRQSPSRRSTSAGSVTSEIGSIPVGEIAIRTSLLPSRSRCNSWRPKIGIRPRGSITSVGKRDIPCGSELRANHANAKNSPNTNAKLTATPVSVFVLPAAAGRSSDLFVSDLGANGSDEAAVGGKILFGSASKAAVLFQYQQP